MNWKSPSTLKYNNDQAQVASLLKQIKSNRLMRKETEATDRLEWSSKFNSKTTILVVKSARKTRLWIDQIFIS